MKGLKEIYWKGKMYLRSCNGQSSIADHEGFLWKPREVLVYTKCSF